MSDAVGLTVARFGDLKKPLRQGKSRSSPAVNNPPIRPADLPPARERALMNKHGAATAAFCCLLVLVGLEVRFLHFPTQPVTLAGPVLRAPAKPVPPTIPPRIAVGKFAGRATIYVRGTITRGENEDFVRAASALLKSLIVLSGPGGDLLAGIRMAIFVRSPGASRGPAVTRGLCCPTPAPLRRGDASASVPCRRISAPPPGSEAPATCRRSFQCLFCCNRCPELGKGGPGDPSKGSSGSCASGPASGVRISKGASRCIGGCVIKLAKPATSASRRTAAAIK